MLSIDSPGARHNGGGANYSPQNGKPNFFENLRTLCAVFSTSLLLIGSFYLLSCCESTWQQAANGMPPGSPFNGMSFGLPPNGMPFGSPPNSSWPPQPGQASPQAAYPNQGFHAPEPQQASTMPSAESDPHSQPAASPPPLTQRSVSDPLGGERSAPVHAQEESEHPPTMKRRFSSQNPFRRSPTLGGAQSAPVHAQAESEAPPTVKHRFSPGNLFRRSRT